MACRERIDPTDDWQLIKPLCQSREQEEYEEIRPLVLFNSPVPERFRETGTPQRTIYRKKERFEDHGMESLFAIDLAAEQAKRQGLEPATRTMIVELMAEHPAFNNNEIKNIVYTRTGRVLGDHTVARVLSEAVVPLSSPGSSSPTTR
jgi:hypothetical protein